MGLNDARRKTSLDELAENMRKKMRTADSKARTKRNVKRFAYTRAKKELRAIRIRLIRDKIGLNRPEFADLLTVPIRNYIAYEQGTRLCPTIVLRAAERELNNHIARIRKGITTAPRIPIPPEIRNNTYIKNRAIVMYAKGKSVEEISIELVLRPEVVRHFLKKIL